MQKAAAAWAAERLQRFHSLGEGLSHAQALLASCTFERYFRVAEDQRQKARSRFS